ncbi:hypothetical protein DR864_01935 [Runella rosea]|uniref:Uncharacterized protein n=1 Tax=Runella rosea TaxID=2259595 RepID=A0A344TD53_9BACT|nr:hypothetical protein [Runella rosea]AXE16574.1 hypothetical protein DR864_01935 [Runella rosea]
MMKYLTFFLLCILGLTTTKTQSASSTSTPISIPKAIVYASDSLVVKDPKKQKRARVISVLSAGAGAVLTIGGLVSGSIPIVIIGGVLVILAILTAQKKSPKIPQKTPESKSSDSSTKGVASPGCAVTAVVGGVAVAGILLYLLLNYGQS